MRWYLNTDHKVFSIDNAVVGGLDFSTLDPTIWMVQWQEDRGEIERQIDKDTNDNGLRENFIDIIPYAPFFQQFLAKCPRLTLTQAKKIDVDLIRQIFESKRQAPFHYPVAAGDYWWDASDDTLMSSTVGAIQNATAKLNEVITKLNAVVAHYNSNFVGIINQNASIGNTLVAQINGNLVAELNAYVVTPHNNSLAHFTYLGDAFVAYINDVVLGLNTAPMGSTNVNIGLYVAAGQPGPPPGISDNIAHSTQSWANPYAATGISNVGPGTFNNATAAPYTPIEPVSVATTQWVPIGSTTPVTVTPAEQAAILNGITARTNDLNIKKNIKIGEVNALTTIAAVIAYDVTTGW